MVCPNCETVYEGNFCPECGQKTVHGRYTINGLANELFFSAFHLEKKGLPYTIKELTLSPGTAIRNVIEGQRLSLYPPFKYLVLIGTVIVILSLRYKFFHNELTQLESGNNASNEFQFVKDNQTFFNGFFKFAEDKATLLNLFAIPVFSLFSFLFFRKYNYNYAENLILNTFIAAQQLLFLVILVPFIEINTESRNILIPIYTAVTMVYNVWVYTQFFGGNKWSDTYRGIITVLTSYLYQFPVNFLVYYVTDNYVSPHIHWIP
jgi:hypothetical protein